MGVIYHGLRRQVNLTDAIVVGFLRYLQLHFVTLFAENLSLIEALGDGILGCTRVKAFHQILVLKM
jgi:hypothetical protein